MTISPRELAERAGCTIQTIHYHMRCGHIKRIGHNQAEDGDRTAYVIERIKGSRHKKKQKKAIEIKNNFVH